MIIKDTIQSSATRPTELTGWTWMVRFEQQNLFITINHDGSRLRELFATEMLDEQLTARISQMLDSNEMPISEIIRELERLTGTHVAAFVDDKAIHSPEHAVAECLRLAESYLLKEEK